VFNAKSADVKSFQKHSRYLAETWHISILYLAKSIKITQIWQTIKSKFAKSSVFDLNLAR
jgi:hypothetical protein